ncbi:MAG TPA: alkaline phosphatase family protein, partial [Solirubrobacterales bacterium]|nr:alkaline phosphatase family protein [Solirubrobacterales bacterium]
MKAAIAARLQKVAAAAATLTGKRFGLLVASSVVATSAIVASAMTGTGGSGALAALLGRSLVSSDAPAASAPEPVRSTGGSAPAASSGSSPSAAEPAFSPAPAPAPASEPVSEPAAKKTAQPAAEAESEATKVKHVFVISLTSPGYEQSLGAQSQMPYLSATLRPQGELLSNYTLLDSGALPNSIAAISGQPPNVATSAGCPGYEAFTAAKVSSSGVLSGTGCVYPVETLTLADQLTSGKLTWRSYAEGMVDEAGKSANCVHPDPGEPSTSAQPGGYAPSQNPFGYFHSLLDLGDCSAYVVPIDQLSKDLGKAEKTASYSFIAPTPCDSGAAGQCAAGAAEGPANADAFLSTWVPKILASPAYKAGGVLVVTFSGVNPAVPGAPPPAGDPLRTGALLLSPFVAPGGTDPAAYGPYSVLRSAEDFFGLDPLALAGA